MGIRIPRVTRDAAQRVSRIAEPACGLVRNDRFLGSAMSIGGGGELDLPILNVWNVWV